MKNLADKLTKIAVEIESAICEIVKKSQSKKILIDSDILEEIGLDDNVSWYLELIEDDILIISDIFGNSYDFDMKINTIVGLSTLYDNLLTF